METTPKEKSEIVITGYHSYKMAHKIVWCLIKEYCVKVISTGTNICFGSPLMYLLENEDKQITVRAK